MKIDKSEYEICVECRVKIEYLTQRLLNGVCPDENELRTLCGLQINKVPDIKPTEPAIMIEAVEDPSEKRIHDEAAWRGMGTRTRAVRKYPPRRTVHQTCGFQYQPEESRQGKSNGTS